MSTDPAFWLYLAATTGVVVSGLRQRRYRRRLIHAIESEHVEYVAKLQAMAAYSRELRRASDPIEAFQALGRLEQNLAAIDAEHHPETA